MTVGASRGRAESALPNRDSSNFVARTFKGSRLRCLIATGLSDQHTVSFLNALVAPHAQVTLQDAWMPQGFLSPNEACLGETALLSAPYRNELTRWWLAKPENANTPNWDLVSSCEIQGRPGLVLVEAKAHRSEFHAGGLGAKNASNVARIRGAIAEANAGLGGEPAGWRLSADNSYQLCNRFAWAWKLATLGIPVVLAYLGFLAADEMGSGAFCSEQAWREAVLKHADGIVPADCWDRANGVAGASVIPLIKAARVQTLVTV